jgi:1,4-dihydroxy-6-naphthoate synthase
MQNRFWRIARRPEGHDFASALALEDAPLAPLATGEIRISNSHLSMDAGTRLWLTDREDGYQPPLPVGAPMTGLVLGEVVEMRYDRILHAVASGEVDAGLIIHESRFTYAEHGLVRVADLGDWWEQETGLPVPLAGICARRDLDAHIAEAAEQAIRASVQYAFDHPLASRAYVRTHAQEMSDAVCDAHIALYVNTHSLDLGDDGQRAIERLVATSPDAR